MAITFPILLEPDDDMLHWYAPRGLPLTYVVATDGTITYQQFGPLASEHFDRLWAEMLEQQSRTIVPDN